MSVNSINLERFSKSKKVIVPIIDNNFLYNRKRYKLSYHHHHPHHHNNDGINGWYEVVIEGNSCKLSNYFFASSVDKSIGLNYIKGYIFNNRFIFHNFDIGKRKTGKEIITDIYFNTCDSFSSVKAVLWEDNQLYYWMPDFTDYKIYELKNMLLNNNNSSSKDNNRHSDYILNGIKGLTPELRTLCLFYELERQRLQELHAEREANKLKQSLHGRLILSFRRVGAELLQYSFKGDRIIVDWQIDDQKFNSVLDKNTFRIIEAGYCMSGHDQDHNIHSMVLLAKDYNDDGLIYKTRDR